MTIAYPTLKMDGKEFVLVPKKDFRRLIEEDRRDARKADRAVSLFKAGKLRTISHADLKRSLGL